MTTYTRLIDLEAIELLIEPDEVLRLVNDFDIVPYGKWHNQRLDYLLASKKIDDGRIIANMIKANNEEKNRQMLICKGKNDQIVFCDSIVKPLAHYSNYIGTYIGLILDNITDFADNYTSYFQLIHQPQLKKLPLAIAIVIVEAVALIFKRSRPIFSKFKDGGAGYYQCVVSHFDSLFNYTTNTIQKEIIRNLKLQWYTFNVYLKNKHEPGEPLLIDLRIVVKHLLRDYNHTDYELVGLIPPE